MKRHAAMLSVAWLAICLSTEAYAQTGDGWSAPSVKQTQTTIEQKTEVTTTELKPPVVPPAVCPPALIHETVGTTVIRQKLGKDSWIAYKLARDPYFYETAAADPSIVAEVCNRPDTARLLCKNRHLDLIADADPLLCRRICQWPSAALMLVKNPICTHVIALDPQGFYAACDRNPKLARLLAKNIMFSELVAHCPDIGRYISLHIP